MLSLLLYCCSYISTGILAYLVIHPVHREDLGVFILCWLIFILYTQRQVAVKDKINSILASIPGWKVYKLEFKDDKPFYLLLAEVVFSALGLLLWMLIRPLSVWDAVSFVVLWQLLRTLLLMGFTKTVRRN